MELHSSYPLLLPFLKKYPESAGALFQTYNDLVYSQQWKDVQVIDIEKCGRAAIQGRRTISDNPETVLSVVPSTMLESLSTKFLQDALEALSDPPALYLAINTDDSSIVYYKISTGIVKPSD